MENLDDNTSVEKRLLFMPLIKTTGGRYIATLTSTAVDRDDEIVGKKFMDKACKGKYLPALLDHDNKVENLVAKWVNKQVIEKDGEFHMIAEPHWFLSNPKAAMIKGMMDEGAEVGVSITALTSSYDHIQKNGKTHKVWTDGEIVSADFVGIQSQRDATAFALAKSFDFFENKNMESEPMSDEMNEKLSALEKKFDADLSKGIQEATDSLSKKYAELESMCKGLAESHEKLEKSLLEKSATDRKELLDELKKGTPVATQIDKSADLEDVSVSGFLSVGKKQ